VEDQEIKGGNNNLLNFTDIIEVKKDEYTRYTINEHS